MKYKRILLKLSGEALAGEKGTGISPEIIEAMAEEIKEILQMGVQVGVVIGGGNIHRGVAGATKGMNRTTSDHMGMLATVINCLALGDHLERLGVSAKVMSGLQMDQVCEQFTARQAVKHLEKGRVVVLAAGTGNPFFTTDTAAALRANEINAEVIMKATKVDGVYDKDPMKHADAKKYGRVSHMDVLKQELKVMDSTAISLCMENNIDIIVFNLFEHGNIRKVILGETVGTLVTTQK